MKIDTPRSYLLRVWPQDTAEHREWRFSLQAIPDGDRIGFNNLVDLSLYLETLTPIYPIDFVPNHRRMTMTPEQIALVKDSFAQVVPMAETASRLFYSRLFEIAPEVEPLFAGTDMARQRHSLMATLEMVVQYLDKPDILVPAVVNLGARHKGYGVEPAQYAHVGEALLWTLAQGLGEAFTSEVQEAWTAAYGALASMMQEAAVVV